MSNPKTLDNLATSSSEPNINSALDSHFESMLLRLKLTKKQREDAKTKYTTVSKLLHAEFYGTEYDGTTKLLIGSYGKYTNIRPPEDVDLLFKISAETYAQYQNNPGALLQRIRKVLSAHYTTTEKISAWGKVVLVKFPDGKHDIELLPGFDVDGIFMIPNTENGGSWDSFDVRTEMLAIRNSNDNTGITRKLIRIIKRWSKFTSSVTIKSFKIEEYCVSFLESYNLDDKTWPVIVRDFFEWLNNTHTSDTTQVQTAYNRSIKAVQLEEQEKLVDACKEWQKVFGNRTFPSYDQDLVKAFSLSLDQPAEGEQFIEDIVAVRINPSYSVSINSVIEGYGTAPHPFAAFIRGYHNVSKSKSIDFYADVQGLEGYQVMWKIRNFGKAATLNNDLRGAISTGNGNMHHESTRYPGTHYVECYVIKDDVCVARSLELVPVGAI